MVYLDGVGSSVYWKIKLFHLDGYIYIDCRLRLLKGGFMSPASFDAQPPLGGYAKDIRGIFFFRLSGSVHGGRQECSIAESSSVKGSQYVFLIYCRSLVLILRYVL
jgi:hypothetical protein